MKIFLLPWLSLLLSMLLIPLMAFGQEQVPCPEGLTCVAEEDMKVFIRLLEDHQCRAEEYPKITADPVVIIVDRDNRIFGSGTGPRPYKLRVDWCNYIVEAESTVEIQAAQRVEPTWGFRLRFKATVGILAVEAFQAAKLYQAIDGGLLIEPFFVQWFNVNAFVGVRSFGAGIGADITKNAGLYAGYSLTIGGWRSNPFVAIAFAF